MEIHNITFYKSLVKPKHTLLKIKPSPKSVRYVVLHIFENRLQKPEGWEKHTAIE